MADILSGYLSHIIVHVSKILKNWPRCCKYSSDIHVDNESCHSFTTCLRLVLMINIQISQHV